MTPARSHSKCMSLAPPAKPARSPRRRSRRSARRPADARRQPCRGVGARGRPAAANGCSAARVAAARRSWLLPSAARDALHQRVVPRIFGGASRAAASCPRTTPRSSQSRAARSVQRGEVRRVGRRRPSSTATPALASQAASATCDALAASSATGRRAPRRRRRGAGARGRCARAAERRGRSCGSHRTPLAMSKIGMYIITTMPPTTSATISSSSGSTMRVARSTKVAKAWRAGRRWSAAPRRSCRCARRPRAGARSRCRSGRAREQRGRPAAAARRSSRAPVRRPRVMRAPRPRPAHTASASSSV